MNEVLCARVKLKNNSVERVRDWAQFISKNKVEALKTLSAEGVQIESVFLDIINDENYLIYYMRSASQERAEEVARKSTSYVDEFNSKFKTDTWDSVSKLELLIDLER